jgi:predicted phage baseplate assembly protein
MKTTGSAQNCGCCEGIQRLTPMPAANRPGLDALAYRVGTHASFLETMKARLSTLCLGDEEECRGDQGLRPLQGLTTRAGDDPSIAFLDAWATLADVLTFYQERIANEGYLLTATERRSILELARLVGYKLRPGVAASVFLAFELERGYQVEIPAGTRAQSLPAPGELPQPFESSEALLARDVWNAIQPRVSQLQVMDDTTHTVYLEGVQANLKPNDPVLVIGTSEDEEPDPYFRRVHKVEIEANNDRTKVLLRGELNLGRLTLLSQEYLRIEELAAPAEPTPADGGTSEFSNPILSWRGSESVSGSPVEYEVTLYRQGEANIPIVDKERVDQTHCSFDQPLEPGTTYEWFVTAIEECRKTSSVTWAFTTEVELNDESPELPLNLDPTPHAEPDPVIETFVEGIEDLVKGRLDDILENLRNPNKPAVELRAFVEIEQSSLDYALGAFNALDSVEESYVDLCEFIAWITDIDANLTEILTQLELRRGVLGASGRLYKNKFIEPKIIRKIILYLKEELSEDTYSSDVPSLSEFAQDSLDIVIPGRIREGVLKILRDDTIVEDEKIQAVKVQRGRLDLLWNIFDILHDESSNDFDSIKEWIGDPENPPEKSWIGLLDQAITDEPSAKPLPRLTQPLSKPPTRPPLNALRLERTVAGTFAEGADVAPRMLTTFQRQLRDTLYQAWAQSEVAPLSPLQSFELLRTKTAPYGAKVPPRPIYNDDCAIIGHNEWPLFEIGVSLILGGDGAMPVLFTLTWETETRQETVALDADSTLVEFTLNGMPIQVFVFELFGQTVFGVSVEEDLIFVLVGQTMWIVEPDLYFSFDENTENTITVYGNPVTVKYVEETETNTWVFSVDNLRLPVPNRWRKVLTLDAEYNQIASGSWIVIEWPEEQRPVPRYGSPLIRRVEKAETLSKVNYGKVTQLTLNDDWLGDADTSYSVLRGAIVYTQSEPLELAEEPIEVDVQGDTIRLDGLYGGLESGRWLIISGERTDITGTSGVEASELAMLAGVKHTVQQIEVEGELVDLRGDRIHTTIQLARKLGYSYKRDTVKIYGNVVKATHGETRQEVLGSGDGSQVMQAFVLRQSPLTYLAAATPAGAQSTIETRVNDIRWHEADNLIWLGANDRGYVTHTDNEDKTTVIFGDGRRGARLPTGVENIKAIYRTGIGKAGNVAAEQISLLATRPLGVKGVINPLAASGGADRERRDQARRNTPLAVMALDRLVSLPDYADFARTYAGIDKASANRLSDGRQELVYLTIAGADDIPIDETSDLYQGLRQALRRFGATRQTIRIAARELILLVISAKVRLLPDYQWESVAPQVRATLLETFSFDRRDLGQDVLLSEVLSTIQRVPGVAYVDVDKLDSVTEGTPPVELDKLAGELGLKERILVDMGRVQNYHVVERKIETLSSIAARYEMDEIDLWELNPDIQDLDNLPVGKRLAIPSRIRPAQLAYLSPEVPDTLILTELT